MIISDPSANGGDQETQRMSSVYIMCGIARDNALNINIVNR